MNYIDRYNEEMKNEQKYRDIIFDTIESIVGKDNIDKDIVSFFIDIKNDEELEMFFSCLNQFGISKDVDLYIYDLFVYKENGEYRFVKNDSKCNIDKDMIIDEYWYSVGYDYYSDFYVIQFERV